MSFWGNIGKEQVDAAGYMPDQAGGGGEWYFGDGQKAAVIIDNVEIGETKGGKPVIKIRWSVVSPERDAKNIKMQNRKVFQSLYPEGSDYDETPEKIEKTSKKASRMISAIDTLYGGMISRLGREPTSEDLMQFWMAKSPITIRIGLMVNRETKQPERNYVSGIGPFEQSYSLMEGVWKRSEGGNGYQSTQPKTQAASNTWSDIDDEVPF